jgi:hypothetical protein
MSAGKSQANSPAVSVIIPAYMTADLSGRLSPIAIGSFLSISGKRTGVPALHAALWGPQALSSARHPY